MRASVYTLFLPHTYPAHGHFHRLRFFFCLQSGHGHLHQYSYTIIITGRQALKHFYHVRITFDLPWRSDHSRMCKQAWVGPLSQFCDLTSCSIFYTR
ncbi:hypothetical protein HBI56_032010 [Parastagonospora nodorum]|uniref:Uncharacterized protein n=1 Tax=Phaeosphaeria nodorum (strain SN15 / ATCC MYA-4574 / FGSC 10173) TaxID=321614 RepID=A0A7U2I0I9_PHANO|nr:hypothetical protein HBH56_019720 [Parastagonospora nodorum]QRC95371.1 hypothetical protein JI435_407230 [Parastagonospora nodorum SN15]KAH3937115.1 hypothetical protein HBH54_014780 [Parastagonospora nodorum]KAH3953586.1 hypothetical protein HBH53_026930 [Parastagonospora nodorum]KAH3962672.1 hypothetical protein HBH51_174870 [Parastagonospora nodorum]